MKINESLRKTRLNVWWHKYIIYIALGITKGLVQYDKSKLVDQSALNEQKKRTMKIKEFVNLQVETFDDMLEIKPVSTFDNYFQRLTSGNIQNMLVQTGDNVNSKETQTETT